MSDRLSFFSEFPIYLPLECPHGASRLQIPTANTVLLTFRDTVFDDGICRVHTAKYRAAKSRFVMHYLRGRSLEQMPVSRNDDHNLKNKLLLQSTRDGFDAVS